mmetsp:Transcript_22223/g.31858  ORF Transcript_22223/g.31858 Transcript_22223/m.31858 type:complete len:398 (+) Transcript_22223:297-1490(+)|eukprot:CAMPEP_0202453564 /NCGR_PEP_ID=MMETSP1360-20130828/11511_1 /ASSEMBLY_ACC=CAM_ASM_000848 /TAXON_ID=515479 /ORGANISM="Licmophora paradoxa, Strain CCMP2313" /LENGTH=397 /DNA_ID=CAMNT_0049072697 /DNA_START=267 /DNA_END=1463 /DNA_ORIENTATION=+
MSPPIETQRRKRGYSRNLRKIDSNRMYHNAAASSVVPSTDGGIVDIDIDNHALFEAKRKLNQKKEGIQLAKSRKGTTTKTKTKTSKKQILVPLLIEEAKQLRRHKKQANSRGSGMKKGRKGFTVQFADQCGRDLEVVHYVQTMYSHEVTDCCRAIILLLSPKDRKFEFVHVSYHLYERSSVASIVEQIRVLATDKALKSQKYTGLLRADCGREMVHSAPIQAYHLKNDSLLVAVIGNMHSGSMMKMAKPLLENKRIIRAVRNAKRNGRNVKQLMASEEKVDGVSEGHTDAPSQETPTLTKMSIENHPACQNIDSAAVSAATTPVIESPGRDDVDDENHPEEESKNISGPLDSWVVPPAKQYLKQSSNRDKANVARVLNFGIFAAVLFGSNKRSNRSK